MTGTDLLRIGILGASRIAVESLDDNPYRNFIAIRSADKDKPWVAALVASYQNPALDKLIDEARFASDPAAYEKRVVEFVSLAAREVPMVPLAQPTHDVAMQKTIGGYQFQPSREPDFRYLTKG